MSLCIEKAGKDMSKDSVAVVGVGNGGAPMEALLLSGLAPDMLINRDRKKAECGPLHMNSGDSSGPPNLPTFELTELADSGSGEITGKKLMKIEIFLYIPENKLRENLYCFNLLKLDYFMCSP